MPNGGTLTVHGSGLVTNKFAGDDFRATVTAQYLDGGGGSDTDLQTINFPGVPVPDPTTFDVTAQVVIPAGAARMLKVQIVLTQISGECRVTNGLFEVTL